MTVATSADVATLWPHLNENQRAEIRWLTDEAARQERWSASPELFVNEFLKLRWWSKQIEIANSVRDNRRTVVYSGHSLGKTFCVAGISLWHYFCFRPSITLTTAPSWSSINDMLWGEIRSQWPKDGPGYLSGIRIYAKPHHYLKGHNAESGASFQGRHEGRVLLVLDEAMGIPLYIWEAANSMMTSPNCRMIVTGNPTETSGRYYEVREDSAYNVIHISCLDHPNIAAELAGRPAPFPKAVSLVWVREMLDRHANRTTEATADSFEFPPGSGEWYDPEDEFRSRVLGIFPKQASQSIWSDAWLLAARGASLEWSDDDFIEIGVDVARFGDDLTTLYARRGPVVLLAEEYAKQDTMETTGRVVDLAERLGAEHGIDAKEIWVKIDDVGLGGGCTDRLMELGYKVRPIIAGSNALNTEMYYNMRSELWFVTAERARDRRLDLSRLSETIYRKLAAELRAVRYKIQSDRRRQVEAKEGYKKRVGHSPDHADGLNLAFATGRSARLEFI